VYSGIAHIPSGKTLRFWANYTEMKAGTALRKGVAMRDEARCIAMIST
jgi:hypothetical protein